MPLLTFLLGLAVGIGFWFWQQHQVQRQLRQMLGVLKTEPSSTAMSVVSRLRSEILLANRYRNQLEEELQIKQQLLQVLPLGYLQVDEENRLLWCNQQARQLLNIERWESGQLRLLLELVRSYELDQLIEHTRDWQQPDVREWVFHPPCVDGEAMGTVRCLTLRASSWPLPNHQVGVFIENRQPLVELSQSRHLWVSDLAHELRTPLTSIHLVAEALLDRVEKPKRRWVEQLLSETKRLSNFVQNWLELSYLEQNPSKSLSYELVELRALIQSVWQTLEPLAQQKQLCFAYSGPDTIWLKADQARLTQVFLNILDNSIKHSPPREAIQIFMTQLADQGEKKATGDVALCTEEVQFPSTSDSATLSDFDQDTEHCSVIQIDIIDSGAGFSESDLPHVFERLYRGDTSRQRPLPSPEESKIASKPSGNGLGLSIVQQIIQAHNGSIQARNHPETGGAWLQIKLPDRKI